jgi:hypothetical protein
LISNWTDPLENWAFNNAHTQEFLNGTTGEFVQKWKYFDLYQKKVNGGIELVFIVNSSIVAKIKLVINKHVFTNGLWNEGSVARNTVFEFLIKWLLPKYKLIISDNLTTNLGEGFWKKVVKFGLGNGYEVGIYHERTDTFESVQSLESIEKAWEVAATVSRIYIKERV